MILVDKRITKALISLRGRAGWSAPVLLANTRRQVFSRQGSNKIGNPRHATTLKYWFLGWVMWRWIFGFCGMVLGVLSSLAIFLLRKRELVVLRLPVSLPHCTVGWGVICDCGIS